MDVSEPAPRFVEDEMLAVERGYRRAKWMWAIIIVVVTGLVVMRISFGGDQ